MKDDLNNYTSFIDEVQKFSSKKLLMTDDLQFLYKCSIQFNKEKLFKEIIFTAKYLAGLFRVLKNISAIQEAKNIELIKSDIQSSMNKITDQLKALVSSSDTTSKNDFEKKYIKLNEDSFNNLKNLIADFEWIKMYYNSIKEN